MTAAQAKAARNGHPREPEAAADTAAITVNGELRRVPRRVSLDRYLASLSLDPRAVVVEHNGIILRDRNKLGSIELTDGDVLEIVHFVGGG